MASLCFNLHTPLSFLLLPRQQKVPSCFFVNSKGNFNPRKVTTTRMITCKKASSRGPDSDRLVISDTTKHAFGVLLLPVGGLVAFDYTNATYLESLEKAIARRWWNPA
ncbi:hypothetical protein PVK06_045687 [Gossypium arboreum]|uniref:Uncharacterized protein n=1 Tax=Gossypium arboreum TaxID=29729 RepID=A0ABR0MV62_GOSAR|nr:hypothetical protein PVK06_045687 [Gossypium arboreum]